MKELKKLEEEINAFADYFLKRYFKEKPSDIYWVANMVGGVLVANDYFFDFDQMLNFIRYKYSVKDMFDYKDYELVNGLKESPIINIKNWKKLR